MKPFWALILFSSFYISRAFGQETEEKFRIGEPFNSIFQELKSGKFSGTVNGILFLKDTIANDFTLDFQSCDASLRIEHDSLEMYDVSYKTYSAKTTSGKTSIEYSVYNGSNQLTIRLGSGVYVAGSHDGASDMVINGLKYQYKVEAGVEFLVLTVDKEIILSNYYSLLMDGRSWESIQADSQEENDRYYEGLRKKERVIKLLPNSTLIFVIRKG